MTRRYGKPAFRLDDFHVNGVVYPILEEVVWSQAVLQSSPFRPT